MKRIPGTVCVTAAGMFGKGAGWGIPISAYTLSFDHEIVDGAPAARFANRLRELIEGGYGLEV